jgi:hypothetical protein
MRCTLIGVNDLTSPGLSSLTPLDIVGPGVLATVKAAENIKSQPIPLNVDSGDSRFNDYLTATLLFEGKPSNHKSDPGGATMYGLTARWHPELAPLITSQTLSRDLASSTIYNKYYRTIPMIESLDKSLGFIIFDSEFVGMFENIIFIQKFIRSNTSIDLAVDGRWGPQSAKASMLLSQNQISVLLTKLKEQSFILANAAAKRVMRYQITHNLPIEDYTAGYYNRQMKRAEEAISYV